MSTAFIQKTIASLEKNNMAGFHVSSIGQLHELLLSFLQAGETVGCGDSVTLEQTGILDLVRSGGFHFLDKFRPGLSRDEKRELYLQNFRADTFLTGINAVTADGRLFNIDGNGSRVAPMLYGPKQVIAVVGSNKLVPTVEEAVFRARQIAAPLDAKRLGKKTPCAKLGKCVDCRHPQRICNDFVLIAGQLERNRIKVIIMEGDYGF